MAKFSTSTFPARVFQGLIFLGCPCVPFDLLWHLTPQNEDLGRRRRLVGNPYYRRKPLTIVYRRFIHQGKGLQQMDGSRPQEGRRLADRVESLDCDFQQLAELGQSARSRDVRFGRVWPRWLWWCCVLHPSFPASLENGRVTLLGSTGRGVVSVRRVRGIVRALREPPHPEELRSGRESAVAAARAEVGELRSRPGRRQIASPRPSIEPCAGTKSAV